MLRAHHRPMAARARPGGQSPPPSPPHTPPQPLDPSLGRASGRRQTAAGPCILSRHASQSAIRERASANTDAPVTKCGRGRGVYSCVRVCPREDNCVDWTLKLYHVIKCEARPLSRAYRWKHGGEGRNGEWGTEKGRFARYWSSEMPSVVTSKVGGRFCVKTSSRGSTPCEPYPQIFFHSCM